MVLVPVDYKIIDVLNETIDFPYNSMLSFPVTTFTKRPSCCHVGLQTIVGASNNGFGNKLIEISY